MRETMVRLMRLTDISIKALGVPAKGVTIYFDDALTGFGVRVSQAGTKSFVLTHGPRRERETLGRVGVVSLQDARAEAKRRLAEYTLGKNRPQSVAWNAAVEEYLAAKAADLKRSTLNDYRERLDRNFKYGTIKLAELSPRDLRKSLDRLGQVPGEQQHAFAALRAFLRWAHRRHYLDRNPMERMTTPHRSKPRERILTSDELKRVYLAAADMETFGSIVQMLILTGQRRGEITNLTLTMIDEDTITLPSRLTKNSREHVFPIGITAAKLLSDPARAQGYVFPARGTGGKKPFNGFSKSKPKIDELADVHDWTLHDLRRTFASGLASLGIALPVIERMLNHISGSFGGIVGVYQRYDFMPEMREAVNAWESYLDQLTRA
jgi:integrase